MSEQFGFKRVSRHTSSKWLHMFNFEQCGYMKSKTILENMTCNTISDSHALLIRLVAVVIEEVVVMVAGQVLRNPLPLLLSTALSRLLGLMLTC